MSRAFSLDLFRCCPLCYRKFEKQNEAEQLIRDMESLIKGPEYRRKIDRDLTLLQEKFDKCLNLKSVHQQLEEFEQKELPTLKGQIKELDQQIGALKTQQSTIEQQYNDETVLLLERCEQIKSDMIMLEKYLDERDEFQRKIRCCQEKLGRNMKRKRTDR